MLILAQAEAAGLTPLEYDLLQRAGLIGSIYGALVLVGLIINLVAFIRLRRRPFPLRPALNRLLEWPWEGRDIRAVLLVLGAGFVGALFLRGPWLRWTADWSLNPASSLVLLQSCLFHVAGLFTVAVLLVRRRRSIRDGFGVELLSVPYDVLKGVVALLGALPALLVLTLLFHLVLHLLGHQPSLQEVAFAIADEPQRWMRIYFVVLAVGLAPLFEEVLFRGLLLPVMARRYGTWTAMLVTSFLFAIIHGHLPSFATLFALSLALGVGYILSGSVLVPIVMHASFNAITTAILLTIK
ncbi:MAG TPA: CPBP family intramembrane metalloprotease [Kiritimatiellia bacterium]|nr:CPBP family intramembrane metalloprotease [Kiritimatiellia bacterium]